MSAEHQLDPVTLAKLKEFGRRRRTIITLRGICAAVISLIGAMVLIAIPDYLFILSDGVRLALSAAAYAVAVIAVWITCVRMMVHLPNERELAQLLESVHPDLREDLISAVELGSPTSDARYDSPTFRSLLQRSVAQRMQSLNVQSLLPWKLVVWWLGGSVAVLALCVGLLMTPDLAFGKLMARALLPMANIARVSSVQVEILEPAPLSPTVPQGDPVRVLVELDGPDDVDRLDRVILETATPGRASERIAMTRQADRRFATTVQVGSEPVVYRILAGDAVTARYTITSRHRPYAESFEKTFTYPEYARLEAVTRTETDGHLTALQGTEVQLTIETDQPVASGELQLEIAGETEKITLQPAEGNRLTGSLPLDRSGTYRVHLVAAETGFENRFSPRYELSAVVDLLPRVEITQPLEEQILPPDEILALRGLAEDDFALASVQQMIRVNGGRWKSVNIADDPGAELRIDRLWDLYELRLSAGDEVVTKLVAEDRAGNRAESEPLRIAVASSGFASDRHATLHAKREANNAAQQFVQTAADHREAAHQAIDHLRQADPAGAQTQRYMVNLREAAEAVSQEAHRAEARIAEATRRVARGTDAHELALLHATVAEARHQHMDDALFKIDRAAQATDANRRRALFDEAGRAFHMAYNTTRENVVRFSEIYAAELALAAANDLRTLRREQQRRLSHAAEKDSALQQLRLTRQLGVAANQARTLAELLRAETDLYQQHRFDQLAELLTNRAEQVNKALDEAEAADEPLELQALHEQARGLGETFQQGHGHAQQAARDLANHATHKRREMAERIGPLHKPMRQLGDQARRVAADHARLSDPESRPGNADQLARQQAEHQQRLRELLHRDWPAMIEKLRVRGAAEEARPDADSRYVADLGLAARALAALHEVYTQQPGVELAEHLRDMLAASVRTLEVGHDVQEMATTSLHLAELEQWGIRTPGAHTQHPKQWDLLDPRFDPISHRIRQAGLNGEAAEALQQVRHQPYAQAIREAFNQRRHQVREPDRMNEPAKQVHDDLQQVLALLRDEIDEARRQLTTASPTLAELLRDAAEQTRQAEQAANDLAEQTPEKPLEEQQDEVAALEQAHAEAREQLADVLDALRQDANVQDPLTPEGRERARDADDATAMIQDSAAEAEAALQEAMASTDPTAQDEALSETAEQQQQLGETLDQLADHFDALESGADLAESRNALREAERDLGLQEGLDEQYEQVAELTELAAMSPDDLLRRLEAQLDQNRPMQRELSSIARDALEQGQAQLEQAGQDERQIADTLAPIAQQQTQEAQSLEEQAAQLQAGAEQLHKKQIPTAAEAVQQAGMAEADEPLAQAQQAAEEAAAQLPADLAANSPELAPVFSEQAQKLNEAAAELQGVAAKAAQASPSDKGKEAAESAEQAAAAARAAAGAADRAAQELANAAPESPRTTAAGQAAMAARPAAQQASEHAQAAQEAAAQSSELAEQAQQQAEAAEQHAENQQTAEAAEALVQSKQAREQSEAQAQQAVDRAEQAARQAQRAANAAEQAAEHVAAETEGDGEVKQELAQAQHGAEQASQTASDAAEAVTEAVAREASSEEATQANAAAAADEAAVAAHDLSQQAQAIAEALTPEPGQLADLTQQQAEVQEAVAEAGRDLGRAARHEERLGNAPMAESLGTLAESVEAVAEGTAQGEAQLAEDDAPPAHASVEAAAEALPQLAQQADDLLSGPQAGEAALAGDDEGEGEGEALADGEATGEAASDSGDAAAAGNEGAAEATADAGAAEAGAAGASAEAMADAGAAGEGGGEGAASSPPGSAGDAALGELVGGNADTPLTDSGVAQALARTLDSLDQAMHDRPSSGDAPAGEGAGESQLAEAASGVGASEAAPGPPGQSGQQPGQQPGGQPGEPGSGAQAAADALNAAAQAQAQAMRTGRSQGRPGQGLRGEGLAERSEEGGTVVSRAKAYQALPETSRDGDDDWGALPPQLARDLVEGRRETISGEYREMVETYFRVIAERSRQQEASP